MTTAYIGFGSNMGDKVGYVRAAVEKLRSADGIARIELSSLYRTAPVGKTDQDWFVNAVGKVDTNLSPNKLLSVCLKIEDSLKRERKVRWGPRTIDLDLLLFGEETIDTEFLQIPHPRMHERCFVLVPLAELEPEIQLRGHLIGRLIEGLEVSDVIRMDI